MSLQTSAICAIVSTFSSTDSSLANIRTIAGQVAHTVVVDDSGDPDNNAFVHTALGSKPDITLLSNKTNLGLASTLNRGIEHALSHGYDWVITFDDDTDVAAGAIQGLVNAVNARFGVVEAANHIYALSRPGHCSTEIDRQQLMPKDVVITTGSLFSASLFARCGGFDTRFFIDLLDFDFCLRARDLNGRVFQLNSPDLKHKLGSPEFAHVLGLSFFLSNHPPFRQYYHFRNAVAFTGRHLIRHPVFVLKLLVHLLFGGVKTILFEKNKRQKIQFAARGIWHGISGRYGKIS